MKMWKEVLKKNNLEYKDFKPEDEQNWYGTMGPYLDMFSAYSLRVNELRLVHNNMPVTKVEGVHKSIPVSKYGLSAAHHVLLEGASFPPEWFGGGLFPSGK
uniref:SFRICE_028573 n=1 Tax=Spodoptera frugiperda TaxID=7108 RepID=A0A2H1WVV8_SPOFR